MPDYRIYEIGEDGHVVRLLIELTLDSDVMAIAHAEQLPTAVGLPATLASLEGRRR